MQYTVSVSFTVPDPGPITQEHLLNAAAYVQAAVRYWAKGFDPQDPFFKISNVQIPIISGHTDSKKGVKKDAKEKRGKK